MSPPIRVLILRPEPQAGLMAAELARRGLRPLVAPMLAIRFEPNVVARILDPREPAPSALVFTSAHAVAAVAADPDARRLLSLPAYAVGPATARAARDAGFVFVVDAGGDGDALTAKLLAEADPATVLVHVAGRDRAVDVVAAMRSGGRTARVVTGYSADPSPDLGPDIATDLSAGRIDIAVVASRRTAETFRRAIAATGAVLPVARPVVAAISRAAAEPLGDAVQRIVIADTPDGASLTEGVVALAAALANNGAERQP